MRSLTSRMWMVVALVLLAAAASALDRDTGKEDLPEEFDAKVKRIVDGDTIVVLYLGTDVRVQIHGIDCPEKEQLYCLDARNYLTELIDGKTVHLKTRRTDRWGRVIADVSLADHDDGVLLDTPEPAAEEEARDPDKAEEPEDAPKPTGPLAREVSLAAPYPAAFRGAPTDRIRIHYALIELAKQAELDYDKKAALKALGRPGMKYIKPTIEDEPLKDALDKVLADLDTNYEVVDGALVLRKAAGAAAAGGGGDKETNVAAIMVRKGMAWWYERYAPDDLKLKRMQELAREEQVGIWEQTDPESPWDYRKRTRNERKKDFPPKKKDSLFD